VTAAAWGPADGRGANPGNLAVLELAVDPTAGWTLLAVHSPLG